MKIVQKKPPEQPPITNALAQPFKQSHMLDKHLFEKANIKTLSHNKSAAGGELQGGCCAGLGSSSSCPRP